MNNNELRSLIVNDLKELLLLFDGMAEMAEIPASVLNLASVKVEHISERIKELSPMNNRETSSLNIESEQDESLSEFVDDELVEEDNDEFLGEDELAEVEEEFEDDEEWEDEDEWEDEEFEEDEDEFLEEKENVEFGTDFADGIVDKASEDVLKVAARDKTEVAAKNVSKRLESRFVVSLKKMGIVDRYRYSKELFGGDMAKLTHTIDVLDGMDSLDDAISYIHSNFSWDEQSAAVADFLVLLENRFS